MLFGHRACSRLRIRQSKHESAAASAARKAAYVSDQVLQPQKSRVSNRSARITDFCFRIHLLASTWYRDSHGLYDYEESQKLTIN